MASTPSEDAAQHLQEAVEIMARLRGPDGQEVDCAAAYIAGLLARKRKTFAGLISAAILAELVIFAGGALWLMLLTGAAPAKVMSLAVLPFIPGEVLKVAAASSLAAFRHRKQRG